MVVTGGATLASGDDAVFRLTRAWMRRPAQNKSAPIPRNPVADAGDGGAAEADYETLTVFDLPFLQTIFLPFFLIFFFLAVAWYVPSGAARLSEIE